MRGEGGYRALATPRLDGGVGSWRGGRVEGERSGSRFLLRPSSNFDARSHASEFGVRLRATLGLPPLPTARGHVHAASESFAPASIRSSFPRHVDFDARAPHRASPRPRSRSSASRLARRVRYFFEDYARRRAGVDSRHRPRCWQRTLHGRRRDQPWRHRRRVRGVR